MSHLSLSLLPSQSLPVFPEQSLARASGPEVAFSCCPHLLLSTASTVLPVLGFLSRLPSAGLQRNVSSAPPGSAPSLLCHSCTASPKAAMPIPNQIGCCPRLLCVCQLLPLELAFPFFLVPTVHWCPLSASLNTLSMSSSSTIAFPLVPRSTLCHRLFACLPRTPRTSPVCPQISFLVGSVPDGLEWIDGKRGQGCSSHKSKVYDWSQ